MRVPQWTLTTYQYFVQALPIFFILHSFYFLSILSLFIYFYIFYSFHFTFHSGEGGLLAPFLKWRGSSLGHPIAPMLVRWSTLLKEKPFQMGLIVKEDTLVGGETCVVAEFLAIWTQQHQYLHLTNQQKQRQQCSATSAMCYGGTLHSMLCMSFANSQTQAIFCLPATARLDVRKQCLRKNIRDTRGSWLLNFVHLNIKIVTISIVLYTLT